MSRSGTDPPGLQGTDRPPERGENIPFRPIRACSDPALFRFDGPTVSKRDGTPAQHRAAARCYSPCVINAALPPAAEVLMVTVCSLAKRSR